MLVFITKHVANKVKTTTIVWVKRVNSCFCSRTFCLCNLLQAHYIVGLTVLDAFFSWMSKWSFSNRKCRRPSLPDCNDMLSKYCKKFYFVKAVKQFHAWWEHTGSTFRTAEMGFSSIVYDLSSATRIIRLKKPVGQRNISAFVCSRSRFFRIWEKSVLIKNDSFA